MRVVVQHLGTLSTCQAEFDHKLATVTDTERQRVLAGIELIERFLSFGIEEECTSPAFSRTKYVGVREAAAEHNHVDILKCLASRNQVGHHHVFHIEACQIEAISHLALTISTLFADDGCLHTCAFTTVCRDTILGEFTSEVLVELHLDRLFLIVLETFGSLAVEALLAVEQIGSLVPDIT